MTHPTDDALLLHAYGEPGAENLDGHLATCAECRTRFARLEEARVATDWAVERPARRPVRRLAWLALPLAAGIAALVMWRGEPARPADHPAWQSHLVASPAGYVAGTTLMSIDSQLTRLESGRTYDLLRN